MRVCVPHSIYLFLAWIVITGCQPVLYGFGFTRKSACPISNFLVGRVNECPLSACNFTRRFIFFGFVYCAVYGACSVVRSIQPDTLLRPYSWKSLKGSLPRVLSIRIFGFRNPLIAYYAICSHIWCIYIKCAIAMIVGEFLVSRLAASSQGLKVTFSL